MLTVEAKFQCVYTPTCTYSDDNVRALFTLSKRWIYYRRSVGLL